MGMKRLPERQTWSEKERQPSRPLRPMDMRDGESLWTNKRHHIPQTTLARRILAPPVLCYSHVFIWRQTFIKVFGLPSPISFEQDASWTSSLWCCGAREVYKGIPRSH